MTGEVGLWASGPEGQVKTVAQRERNSEILNEELRLFDRFKIVFMFVEEKNVVF